MKLVFTRPQGQNDELLAQLSDHQCIELPLLQLQPLVPNAAERQWLLNLDRYDHILVTSPMASQCLLEQAEQYWPQWPLGLKIICPGPGSAQALMQAGLACQWPTQASGPDGRHSASAMLNLTALAPRQRLLLATGEVNRQDLQAQLQASGHQVDRLPLYRRQDRPLSPSDCQLLCQADWVLLSSQQGLANLVAALHSSPWPRPRLLLSSQRLAAQAQSQGYRVALAQSALSQDFIQAVHSLAQDTP